MAISVHIKPGDIHPLINELVFHGPHFQRQVSLYCHLQTVVNKLENNFITQATAIEKQLKELEWAIIIRRLNFLLG